MESLFGDSEGSPEERQARKALFDAPNQEDSLFGNDNEQEGRGSPWLEQDDNAPAAAEERQQKPPVHAHKPLEFCNDEHREGSPDLSSAKAALRPVTPQQHMPSFEQPTPHSEIWGSPKGIDRPASTPAYGQPPAMRPVHDRNGSANSRDSFGASRYGPGRTTSVITTRSPQGSMHSRNDSYTAPRQETYALPRPTSALGNEWRANGDAPAVDDVRDGTSGGEGGFGNQSQRPSVARSQTTGFEGGSITVHLLPEKEGPFLFQHHNYQLTGPRGSKVVRRYSDFLWLLECLHKRYPFRRLPLLPPKRVGVNGSYLASDSGFLEKRRRGLARFSNALVRHPVLSQEQLVVQFLTVPTELAVWAKQATMSLEDEFAGKVLPPGHDVPPSEDLFDTTRSGLKKSSETYINLCNLVDRMVKRSEGLAADHGRLVSQLNILTDATHATYSIDDTVCPKPKSFALDNNKDPVPPMNQALGATARYCNNHEQFLMDESRAWDMGVLEDLKAQRDALVSMREMFDRRDQYERDSVNKIPNWEKRIKKNEDKLANIRQKPEGMVKPGEVEKVQQAIATDKESIVAQRAKTVFVTECVRDELTSFQHSQKHVIHWNYDWVNERVKYSGLQQQNWMKLQKTQKDIWEEMYE